MGIKRMCQLLLKTDHSNRQIAATVNKSHNTVGKHREALRKANVTLGQLKELTDPELQRLLFGSNARVKKEFVEPDWSEVHAELSRPHVNLSMLHEEYVEANPDAYMSEREFRRRHEKYASTLGIVMRKPRQPGQNLEVDYSGKRPKVRNADGRDEPQELFVAVVGSSTKSFAYTTPTQQLPDFIDANVRALEYFGSAPHVLISDNLKSAVVRYDTKEGHFINPSFERFADHYDLTVLPTKPRSPKHKATVENAVRLMQRWILGKLRNRIFFSREELNEAIMALNDEFNARPMKKRGNHSRNELFDELDAPLMQALPVQRYSYADWKVGVRVPKDYHVPVDRNHYSVPHEIIGERVDVRITRPAVEIYLKNRKVAEHERSLGVDQVITKAEHRPPNHRGYFDDQLDEALSWAERTGAAIHEFLRRHMEINQGAAAINGIKGIKRLARDYGIDRLEKACARGILAGAITTHFVRSTLTNGLEDKPLTDPPDSYGGATHDNVRGAQNYDID